MHVYSVFYINLNNGAFYFMKNFPGSYPKSLVAAWEHYDKRMKSENDHPCIFSSSQHFLLLAFEDGGVDLEKYVVILFVFLSKKHI